MSNISNRFFVTALADGTTLHGSLSADGSLSQAWNGSTAVPNWGNGGNTGTADQPTIMLTLLNGSKYIGTDTSSLDGYISESKWYYNDSGSDSEITFSSSLSTITLPDNTEIKGYKSLSPLADMFLKVSTVNDSPVTANGVPVPALRVIKNLASSENVDIDTITFKGKFNSGSGILDFQATAQIRISEMSSGAFLGTISFTNGISDITQAGQNIGMTATLYGSDGNAVSSLYTQWFLNGTSIRSLSNVNTITVNESQVVDNAVVRCDMYEHIGADNVLRATAYAYIDDMQDPEFMYIQYNGANGNAASLRSGQSATFDIWIGRTDDADVDDSFAYFQAQLLDGSGSVITESLTGINPVVSDGWRNLNVDSTTKKARITIAYSIPDTHGKNITGLVRASTSPLPQTNS